MNPPHLLCVGFAAVTREVVSNMRSGNRSSSDRVGSAALLHGRRRPASAVFSFWILFFIVLWLLTAFQSFEYAGCSGL